MGRQAVMTAYLYLPEKSWDTPDLQMDCFVICLWGWPHPPLTTIRVGSCMVHAGRKSFGVSIHVWSPLKYSLKVSMGWYHMSTGSYSPSTGTRCVQYSCRVQLSLLFSRILSNTSEFNVGSFPRNERGKGSHQEIYSNQRLEHISISCSTNSDSDRRQCWRECLSCERQRNSTN